MNNKKTLKEMTESERAEYFDNLFHRVWANARDEKMKQLGAK